MRISDWSSDVCSSDLHPSDRRGGVVHRQRRQRPGHLGGAVGHADRSGPKPYNERLSKRRAEAVRAALVQQGVSAGEVGVVSKGETDPLVPTQDGVWDTQNRRVEIVLQDRECVGSGTRGAYGVSLGGCGNLEKKKTII